GVDPENGDPLWEKIDEDGISVTNNYSESTIQVIGSYFPEFTGGLYNEFSFKGFTLSAFFNFVGEVDIYNNLRTVFDADGNYPGYNQMVLPSGSKRWDHEGDIASHPKPVFGGNKNSRSPSSRYLEKGSY